MPARKDLFKTNLEAANNRFGTLSGSAHDSLEALIDQHQLSVAAGDLLLLDGRWYVTHAGLLRLSRRKRCRGIHVSPLPDLSDPAANRWKFKAVVYTSPTCKGFDGYGDADPSNVSALVRGAEMRVAETRPSTVHSARPTVLASARSKKSVVLRTDRGQERHRLESPKALE